jgi:anti-sigma regulatory factor (Ser/Thr protein kinase)
MTAMLAGPPVVRVFSGERDRVAHARHFVASLLAGHPAADEAVLLTSELATNAVLHTASGRGGFFRVVVCLAGERVRIEVHDGGSDTAPDVHVPSAPEESGSGLFLVASIAARWGHRGGPDGRMVWFEVEES